MTGAACLFEPAPVDTGDVLASIRRLIASDTATPGAKGGGARMTGASFSRDGAQSCATSLGCGRSVRAPFVDGDRAATLPETAHLAAPGMIRQFDSDPGQMPLRLKPEAMIATAEAASHAAGPLRLSQQIAAARPVAAPPGAAAPSAEQDMADPFLDEVAVMPGTAPMVTTGPDAQPVLDLGSGSPAAAGSGARDSNPHDLSSPSNKETTMHAYPTGVVSPLHAEPMMAGAPERCAQNMVPAASLAAAPASASPATEENPLRALLREVVREEFEAEMQRRLDDSLRGMIRGEIVVALTEALVRRPV